MSFIEGRLRRLEGRMQEGGRCPECGLPPDGPGHIVTIDQIPEGAEENCPGCGRPLWTVIKVVYGDDAGEDVGGGGYRWP